MLAHDSKSYWANRRGKWLISYALVSIYANLSCSALQEEFVPRDELPYYLSIDALRAVQFLASGFAVLFPVCNALQTISQAAACKSLQL
jgi:hypothetical protein